MKSNNSQLKIIGHRGCAGLYPENSLSACAHAINIGLDGIEIDVQFTADGEIVVYHDFHLNPEFTRFYKEWVTEQPKAINSLSMLELQAYDIGLMKEGSNYYSRFLDRATIENESIPSLNTILKYVKENAEPHFKVWIELKTSPIMPELSADPHMLAAKVMECVYALGMKKQIVCLSFDWRGLQYIQQQDMNMVCAYLTSECKDDNTIMRHHQALSPWLAGYALNDHESSIPRLIAALGGKIWSPHYKDISLENVQDAHKLGVNVYPWTVNKLNDVIKLTNWSVEGIITDYPIIHNV